MLLTSTRPLRTLPSRCTRTRRGRSPPRCGVQGRGRIDPINSRLRAPTQETSSRWGLHSHPALNPCPAGERLTTTTGRKGACRPAQRVVADGERPTAVPEGGPWPTACHYARQWKAVSVSWSQGSALALDFVLVALRQEPQGSVWVGSARGSTCGSFRSIISRSPSIRAARLTDFEFSIS
jgi:hypothetical protein